MRAIKLDWVTTTMPLDNGLIIIALIIAGVFGLCILPIILALVIEALPIVLGVLVALWLFNAMF